MFRVSATSWAFLHYIFLFWLLIMSVAYSGSTHRIRVDLQNSVFDQFNILNPRTPTDKVVIVDIDEASLEKLGQWPWPRNVMADLTKSLTEKGAKVIAFDGVFSEEDRASPHYFLKTLSEEERPKYYDGNIDEVINFDAIFADAIKQSKVFVTAFTYGRRDRTQNKPVHKNRILARDDVMQVFLEHATYFDAAAVNLQEFANNAAGNGSFMARPDADGVLRRVGTVFSDGEKLYPSLSVEALRVGVLGPKGSVRLASVPEDKKKTIDTNYRLLIGEHSIPIEQDGILYVRYRHFCNQMDMDQRPECNHVDYISAYKFLEPEFENEARAFVKDKYVLIGASAEGLKDLRSTALKPFRPGVEVHANVMEQILAGEYLLRPLIIQGVEASFIFAAGLIFIVLAPLVGVIVSVIMCMTIIGVAVFGAYMLYLEHGVLVDPVYPSLSVFVIFVASLILSYARAEMRRKQIRNAFGMYVARGVMRDLERNPDKLVLGGENRNLTIMFTDIRKFTSISEGLKPEELINLMNEFLTEMTDIVMKHHGTVDKYIGDAMMAFWNAPGEVENHERQACLAALKMQTALEPINRRILEKAEEQHKKPVLLQAGIGINTGECAVGNMGSKQRFAYSALGDAVNVASRLEGQTKVYSVSILIGEKTADVVQDLAVLELDTVRVVGKNEAQKIFALVGDADFAEEQLFQEWRTCHVNFLTAYKSQKFDDAIKYAKECQSLCHEDNKSLYTMYQARIKVLKKQNLPADWDGVYVAVEK
ncbi:MAG: CHASE2 domain-containing protein [Alphaproteobacteria bacterium]|nr:CHASE2 domain-containing protein [Alphaproteobacteria bacterium]